MKRLENKKRWLGYLLAALMVLPLAVKTVHIASCCKHDIAEQEHHDCTDCPVCCFAFSLFTQTENMDMDNTVYYIDSKIFIYNCETVKRIIHYFNLRAPPF